MSSFALIVAKVVSAAVIHAMPVNASQTVEQAPTVLTMPETVIVGSRPHSASALPHNGKVWKCAPGRPLYAGAEDTPVEAKLATSQTVRMCGWYPINAVGVELVDHTGFIPLQ